MAKYFSAKKLIIKGSKIRSEKEKRNHTHTQVALIRNSSGLFIFFVEIGWNVFN